MVASSFIDRSVTVSIVGGVLYAIGIIGWALTTGFQFAAESPFELAVAVGYVSVGMFLIAALPLYALGRLSLISPGLVAIWSFGNTVYLRLFVSRPHDALASYLTVWPLFVGLIAIAILIEGGLRTLSDRTTGRFGIRPLW